MLFNSIDRYVPSLAHKLQNEGNETEIWKNLKGIAVGDGLFDPATQASTWSSFGVNVGIVDTAVRPLIYMMY